MYTHILWILLQVYAPEIKCKLVKMDRICKEGEGGCASYLQHHGPQRILVDDALPRR